MFLLLLLQKLEDYFTLSLSEYVKLNRGFGGAVVRPLAFHL